MVPTASLKKEERFCNSIDKLAYLLLLLLGLSACGKVGGLLPTDSRCYKDLCFQDESLESSNNQENKEYFIKNSENIPIKDQGPLGTCASFSVCDCASYVYHQYVNNNNTGEGFSEAEFNILTQTMKIAEWDFDTCQGGVSIGKALKVANQYGLIEASRLPYSTYVDYVAMKNKLFFKYDYDDRDAWEAELSKNSERLDVCQIGNYNHTMEEIDDSIEALETGGPTNIRWDTYNPNENKTIYRLYPLKPLYTATINTSVPSTPPLSYNNFNSSPYGSYPTSNTNSLIDHLINNLTLQPKTNNNNNSNNNKVEIPELVLSKVKKVLAKDYPVVMAVDVYQDCWSKLDTDTIKMPKYNLIKDGSHAVVIVGCSDQNKSFIIRNSWGENWGLNGYGYIPYKYVQSYATEILPISLRKYPNLLTKQLF